MALKVCTLPDLTCLLCWPACPLVLSAHLPCLCLLLELLLQWTFCELLCLELYHRHQSIIDCLSFVMCPLLAPLIIGFFSFFFCCSHLQYYWSKQGRWYVPLSSLYFLDVYELYLIVLDVYDTAHNMYIGFVFWNETLNRFNPEKS